MIIAALLVVIIMTVSTNASKDLVQKGLVESIGIENKNLIVKVKEGSASGLSIGQNGNDVYSRNFEVGTKISILKIENYLSIFNDKKIYHFMLYHYELGGHQFSGFDFCIDKSQVYYGKELKNCLKEK